MKTKLSRPHMLTFIGLPGAGKSSLGKAMAEQLGMAFVSADRLRFELFENPSYAKDEEQVVENMLSLLTEQLLELKLSLVYDGQTHRYAQRKALREMARRHGYTVTFVWLQIDAGAALSRTNRVDRRKADDKYRTEMPREAFDQIIKDFQPPSHEDHLVVSGKHTTSGQRNPIIRKLAEHGLLGDPTLAPNIAKPGLVNNVPARPGRFDLSRRDILIK